MNEKMKCFNMHGHTYLCELTFEFEKMKSIGYAIDFKEIKRVGCQWIDDILDHGMILNPHDAEVIKATVATGSKMWLMSLNGQGEYCNPSVENIAKEVFLAMEVLFENYEHLRIHKVKIYETPNCFTECFADSIDDKEWDNWQASRKEEVANYRDEKGELNYDDRE